jgi:carbon monoxide dehydrogenase subunit G
MDFRGRYSLPARPETVWQALHDPGVLGACIPGCEGVAKLSATEYRAQMQTQVGPLNARFTGRLSWTDHAPPEGAVHAGTLMGEAQGGAAGSARGECEMRVAQGRDSESAVLTYESKIHFAGALAQLDQRAIESAAKDFANAFFAKFAGLVRSGTTSVPIVPRVSAKGEAEPAAEAPSKDADVVPATATPEAASPPVAPEAATEEPASPKPAPALPVPPAAEAVISEHPPSKPPQYRRGGQDLGLRSQIWLVGVIGIVVILLFFFSLVL